MGQIQITEGTTSNTDDVGDLRTGWRDLLSAVNAARVTGASEPTFTAFRGGIYQYSFSASTMNQVVMNPFHIDHDYKSGTDLFVQTVNAPRERGHLLLVICHLRFEDRQLVGD